MTIFPFGVGDPAPDAELVDGTGGSVQLSVAWANGPSTIVFIRYFGCPFCQAQVVALREDRDRFESFGADVTVIGQGTPQECAEFCDARRVPFRVLVDPDRRAYRAYGLGKGGAMQVMGPQMMLPWIRNELHKETRQHVARGASYTQMPGTFVVDVVGIVRFAHRSRHVADIPRNHVILKALAELAPDRDATSAG
jgi:peroxiredoxin